MIELASRLIDYLQAKFPPNRVVVLATPVLAAGAGYVTTWTAKHVAFLHLSEGQLAAIFIAGAATAVPLLYKWLDGWQKHEASLRPGGSQVSVHGVHVAVPGPVTPIDGQAAAQAIIDAVPTTPEPEPPADQHGSSTAPSESTGGSSPEAEELRAARREAELRRQGHPPPP